MWKKAISISSGRQEPSRFRYWRASWRRPNAKAVYTAATGNEITDVGFVLPDGTDAYGGSPDGLVGDDGMIEVKCPAPETLITYHAEMELPAKYKPQVQGLLLITGREWCAFFVFHPQLTPFLTRVEPDVDYQSKIAEGLLQLLEGIAVIESRVDRMEHKVVSGSNTQSEVRWNE